MAVRDTPDTDYISDVITGFQVRLPKIDLCEYFPNHRGGRAAALIAARAYRDAIVAKTNYLRRADYRAHSRMHNRSGNPEHLSGLLLMVYRQSGYVRAYFKANYKTESGDFSYKSYSIRQFGYVRAYELALEFRRQFVDDVALARARMPRPPPEQYAMLTGLAADIPRPQSRLAAQHPTAGGEQRLASMAATEEPASSSRARISATAR